MYKNSRLVLISNKTMIIIRFYLILITFSLIFANSLTIAKQYKGAELRTKDTYTYGRFEVSFIPAKREGVVSSFFTYHEITNVNNWNEIDFEFIGRYDNQIQCNVISPGQRNHEASIPLDFNPYADFHTYAFEWTPDYIAWFVDGEEIYRQTEDHVVQISRDQKIMMNIWPPNYIDWVGKIEAAHLPARAYYDWVSYASFTPGSGNVGTNNNFTQQWRDDFDNYDSNRWTRGTHTWTGNESDFVWENVQYQNGFMILCLTREGETGLVDNQPPLVLWAKENSHNQVIIRFSEEVDKITAETLSNYIIPGVTIISADLSADKTFTTLSTQNYNPNSTNNVIVQNIKDDRPEGNTISTTAKTVKKISNLQFPVKINVGGPSILDFLPDQEWEPNLDYGYLDGSPTLYPPNHIISNTDIPEIFRSERYRLVTYRIDVPNGTYNVKLQFAENYFSSVDQRVFDITIENQKVAEDLDIYNLVGSNTAYELETEISIDDDRIDIYFTNEINYALLNGIEINQLTTNVLPDQMMQNNFRLNQNYPNPFNPSTTIEFSLSEESFVALKIFDLLGREVNTLINEIKEPGEYRLMYLGENLSAGVYFYKLIVNNRSSIVKKMIFLK